VRVGGRVYVLLTLPAAAVGLLLSAVRARVIGRQWRAPRAVSSGWPRRRPLKPTYSLSYPRFAASPCGARRTMHRAALSIWWALRTSPCRGPNPSVDRRIRWMRRAPGWQGALRTSVSCLPVNAALTMHDAVVPARHSSVNFNVSRRSTKAVTVFVNLCR